MAQVAQAFLKGAPYLAFTFESLEDGHDLAGGRADPDIVLDAAQVIKAEATGEILGAYGVSSPVSENHVKDYEEAMRPLAQAVSYQQDEAPPTGLTSLGIMK